MFDQHRQKSTLIFTHLEEDYHKNLPVFPYAVKTTFYNYGLVYCFHACKLKTITAEEILFGWIVSFFVTGSTEKKNPTKKITPCKNWKMFSKSNLQLQEDSPLYHDALCISIKTPSFYCHDTFLVEKDDSVKFKGHLAFSYEQLPVKAKRMQTKETYFLSRQQNA